MSFKEMLETPRAEEVVKQEQELPKAWRASKEHRPDGSVALVTGPLPDTEDAVDEYMETHGFDRKHWMLKPGTGVLSKNWDALRRVFHPELGDGGEYVTEVEPMVSSRIEVVPRTIPTDIEELLEAIDSKPVVMAGRGGDSTGEGVEAGGLDDPERRRAGVFGLALGDLQLGKADGSGPGGTVERFKHYVSHAVLRFARSGLADVHLAFLGDCIEGFVSQGGRNAWRTSLTTTEQVRLLRRLMLWAIDQFIDAGVRRLTVVSVPGNHDEVMRSPVGTRSDDSWAIDALVAVADAMELNPRYAKVECFVPGPDQMDVTLDLDGLIVTHNHGHQYLKGDHKKSAFTWWEGQKFSDQPAGMADLMLSGHGHHYQVAERSGKTWCMVPALEELSVWWVHKTGQTGDPGVVVFEIVDGVLETLTRVRLPEKPGPGVDTIELKNIAGKTLRTITLERQ